MHLIIMIRNVPRMTSIREVAFAAGVSRQTVSRVVNDHPSVRPSTRRRVLQTMERMGFVVHNGARSLRSRRSRVIGVLVESDAGAEAREFLPTLEAAARRQGLWMLVGFSASGEDAQRGVNRLRAAAVDGVVVLSASRGDEDADDPAIAGFPVLRICIDGFSTAATDDLADIAAAAVAGVSDIAARA